MTDLVTTRTTRATSARYFAHIFSLFEHDSISPIILGLQNKLTNPNATATLMDFLSINQYEFIDFIVSGEGENEVKLTRGQMRLAKNIHNWINYEMDKDADVD